MLMCVFCLTFASADVTREFRAMTESEFNRLVEREGVYQPDVNYNVIVNGFGTGLRPPRETEWRELSQRSVILDLPATMSSTVPTSHDNSATVWFPPVGNQGAEGSCVSWATAYYTKTFQEAFEHNRDLSGALWEGSATGYPSPAYQDLIFSPDFIYHQVCDGEDNGSYYSDNLNLMNYIGCCSWEKMPYDPTQQTVWPSEPAWRQAPLYRSDTGYGWIWTDTDTGLDDLKWWLSENNLAIISVDAYKYEYLTAEDLWTTDQYSSPSRNHANTVVGYDDSYGPYSEGGEQRYGAFKVVNSWGTEEWDNNNDGFYYISYECMKQWIEYVFAYVDLIGYQPQLLAVFSIQHDQRGRCELAFGIEESPGTYFTKNMSRDFTLHGGDHPFPENNMVIDISEFLPYGSGAGDNLYLSVCDSGSTTGWINAFSVEFYDDYLSGSPVQTWHSSDIPLQTAALTPVYATIYTDSGAVPDIAVSPAGLYHNVHTDTLITDEILIRNDGSGELTFDVEIAFTSASPVHSLKILKAGSGPNDGPNDYTEYLLATAEEKGSTAGWLNVTPLSGSLAASESMTLEVVFNSELVSEAVHTASILIHSNDPEDPVITVGATLNKTYRNLTTNDNENNAYEGIPDYDMDTYLFNTSSITPIEFNIFIGESTIADAQLSIYAWDIDETSGEIDQVYLNGHYIGDLTGADNQWSTSVFNVDPAYLNPGPSGKNTVMIDIDIHNSGYWATTVDWGQLVINGGTSVSSAWIRTVNLDNSQYHADENIAVTVEVDTDTSSMEVVLETNLLDPDAVNIAGISNTVTISGTEDDPVTELLYIPYGSAPGTYTVQVLVYDAETYIQQDMELIEVNVVDLTAGITVTPASLSEELQTGTMSTRILSISNTGGSDLSWETVPLTSLYLSEYHPFTGTSVTTIDNLPTTPAPETGTACRPLFSKRIYDTRDASLSELNTLLLEEHNGIYHYDNALNALGMGRTLVTTWDHFYTELTNGTPWDLVIVNSYSNPPGSVTLDQLSSYVSGGGLLIFTDWYLSSYATHSLVAEMNISWESDLYSPLGFYPTVPSHPVFNFPNQTPDFAVTDDQYNIDGQRVGVSGGGNALAAYTGYPSNPAIVLNASGNCFFNAFQAVNFNADNDTDGKADIQELIENQIMYLTETTYIPEWLSTGPPSSGIIPPGASQDVPVNFDATCLSPGEYTASIDVVSNDPDHGLISIPVLCNVIDLLDADITLSIAGTEGVLGNIVSIPVIADSGFTNVGMLELQVAFDTTLLGYENMYSEYLSAGDVNAAGENINIVWVYSGTPMMIPDGDTLIVFHFRVSELAAGGDHCVLGFTENCNIADPDENTFALALNPGTFTVIQSYGISGSLSYCDNGSPLIADTLYLCGDVNATAVTDGDGRFIFSAAFGSLALFPLKEDEISSIDGFDLLRLKNSLLEVSDLTANEMLAADCDGNGTPDGLDLLRLKNHLLMIPVDPPALTWAFTPEAYFYDSLASDMDDQDFTAFLYGDVNLSWGTSAATPAGSEENAMAQVSFGEFSVDEQGFLHLPVYTDRDLRIAMLDWNIRFDTTELRFTGLESELIGDYHCSGNTLNCIWLYDGEEKEIAANSIIAELIFRPEASQAASVIAFSGANHLAAADESPVEAIYGSVTVNTALLSLLEGAQLPTETTLYRNYPNPFNPSTVISYYLKDASDVTVKIYNLRGESLQTWHNGYQDPGFYQLTWNGRDAQGRSVPTGIYFYQLLHGEGTDVRRMVYMK